MGRIIAYIISSLSILFLAQAMAADPGIAFPGDSITVIHKPEVGHHPHSVPQPEPIEDFILAAVRKNGASVPEEFRTPAPTPLPSSSESPCGRASSRCPGE